MKALLILLLSLISAGANPDSFRELFADPATRKSAIATLTPGTRDYYFFTALDHQLNNQANSYEKTIASWKAASEIKKNPISTGGLDTLENRRIISAYDKNPKAALAELTRTLDLKFTARKPDSATENKKLSTALDPKTIAPAAYEADAKRKDPATPYQNYTSSRLYTELNSLETFDDRKVRWLAENFERYDHPKYTALLAKVLGMKPAFSGSRVNYSNLTLEQLEQLKKSTPSLLSETGFNRAYLKKLAPAYPAELERHPEAYAAFLAACKDYAISLPPSQNTLKAHVFFHHLRLQEILGNYPKEDLLSYLALPRRDNILVIPTKESDHYFDVRQNFSEITACPPINDENIIISRQLAHHLATSDTPDKEIAAYIPKETLGRLHALSQLHKGADPTRWAAPFKADHFKQLREEIQIIFAPTVPGIFTSDEEISMPLNLKNTPSLLVRIYEIDSENPTASLDLDGLVPHYTRTITYKQAPFVIHREDIALPELKDAGTWIVEFVSDRISARTLIRKGNITPHISRTPDGQLIRLFDEKSRPVEKFTLTLGTETFTAKNGEVTVANASNQPVINGRITAGKLSERITLFSRADSLTLESSFFLDREQLLANQKTNLRLRTQLTNHGQPIALKKLQNPTLVLKATLLSGITTERVIADPLELQPTNEIPILIPADTLSLSLTLSGTVTSATNGLPQTLTASTSYNLNGSLKTSRIATALFSPTTIGHQIHILGRNGEPLPDRPVTLSIEHKLYSNPVITELRSDKDGLINLGKLAGITKITATSSDFPPTIYSPPVRKTIPPADFIIPANQTLRVPLQKPAIKPEPADVVFYSLINSSDHGITIKQDSLSSLTVENNHLVLKDLRPGDYYLLQGSDFETNIKVLPAKSVSGNLLVTPDEIVPLTNPFIPTIASAEAEGGNITINIANPSPETRVTLVGKRYHIAGFHPGYAPYPYSPEFLRGFTRSIRPSFYLTERKLNDEIRYILNRRTAKTFPGSMLPRPGLLLHRWTPEELDQETEIGRSSEEGNRQYAPSAGGGSIPNPSKKSRGNQNNSSHSTVIDFLKFPAIVRFNLKPDKHGNITVPLASFRGAQFIEIIAADTEASDTTYLSLPLNATPLRDRRIARPLGSKSHHIATRFAAALAPGAEAKIENLLAADWRAFTTLGEAHQFLLATTGSDQLRTFGFLTTWPTLEEKQKLALLEDHHCHELHLFLSRKDPAFFEKFVKPHLGAKPEPQFIDDYLLGRDLKSYLRPYAFSRLNAAEKALLAQALPASKKAISIELDLRWKVEAPSPDAETILFSKTLKGSDLSQDDSLGLARNMKSQMGNIVTAGLRSGDSEITFDRIDGVLDEANQMAGAADGASYITEKLRRTVIPRIHFEDTTVEEAIDFLRLRSAELDTLELDPSRKGINFVLSPEVGRQRISGLKLRNVPIAVALKYIADATKLRYTSDDFAVTLKPQTEVGEDLFTRTYSVPPDFASMLGRDYGSPDSDPFADSVGAAAGSLAARPPIADLLRQNGINLPEGASATLSASGKLIVTTTPSEMDKIESLTATLNSNPPASSVDAFADSSEIGGLLPPLDLPDEPQVLFPDRTKLWLESNYYKSRSSADESLIPLNRFWLELSAWDGKAPFTSPHFNACTHSAADALMCLAMLDLPFTAEKPEVTVEDGGLKVKARAPMLLFYKDTRETEKVAADSPLLVRQSYQPLAEPFRTDEQGRKVENTITGDLRAGVPYGLSLVVTNPTGTERRIETLAQIPAGAIALGGHPETLSTAHQLAPYGVIQLKLAFYFPAPGDFAAYPLHVSENDNILAHAQPRTLRVTADPAPEDAASWLVIARDGTEEAVLNRLSTENLSTINLNAILWRLQDRGFYLEATEILRKRLQNIPRFYHYAVLHNDPTSLSDFIENSGLAKNLGQWFSSDLISITPAAHHDWQTQEFDPLVNPRAHSFGNNPRLSHPKAREHYEAFLDTLIWKAQLSSEDQLTFTYFLFLQDRIEEALARFAKIKPVDLADRLQYDYLQAVALFHQEKPAEAKAIAAPYVAKLPPSIWRDRFQTVTIQADEISKPIKALPPEDRSFSPILEISQQSDGKLLLKHENLKEAKLSLYNIDLEVLFSKDPFLRGGLESSLPPISPNKTITVAFEKNAKQTVQQLPKDFRQGNILVAAESGDVKELKILNSRQIETRVISTERSIQVIDPTTQKPVSKTYIKVFAEYHNGSIAFHKDGYTDLRGKFDYLSSTVEDPAGIKRLAVLISHPEKGSRTQIITR